MTVEYVPELSSAKFQTFPWLWRVLFRWDGSIFQSVGFELTILMLVWYGIYFVIEFGLDKHNSMVQEGITFIREYQDDTRTLLSFVLVYFYQSVYDRAKSIFMGLPFPDPLLRKIANSVGKRDERGQLLRVTMARYVLAATFLMYHGISSSFRDKYPEACSSLLRFGLLTEDEIKRIQRRHMVSGSLCELAWLPLGWARQTSSIAFREGQWHVIDGHSTDDVEVALNAYGEQGLKTVWNVYLAFPLLLVQVVTVSLYVHLFALCFGYQRTRMNNDPIRYFPLFMLAEAFGYLGAFRVGQLFLDPLGPDDNDFEIVRLWARHMRAAHAMGLYGVGSEDDLSDELPPLTSLDHVQASCIEPIPIYFHGEL